MALSPLGLVGKGATNPTGLPPMLHCGLSSNSAPNQPLYPLPYPTVLTKLKFAQFCTRVFNLEDMPWICGVVRPSYKSNNKHYQQTHSFEQLIVTAASNRLEFFRCYQTEGVSNQMQVMWILLYSLQIQKIQLAKDWEINIWCQYISTSTESDSNSTDSWFPSIQFFCPSLLYICLTNQYFELDKIFVIVSFIMQLELFQALLVHLCILRFYYRSVSNFPSSFYIGHKLKLSIWPKFILLLLLQNWTIHLDWSPRPLWLLHSTSLGAALENFEKHKFHWNTFSVNWML